MRRRATSPDKPLMRGPVSAYRRSRPSMKDLTGTGRWLGFPAWSNARERRTELSPMTLSIIASRNAQRGLDRWPERSGFGNSCGCVKARTVNVDDGQVRGCKARTTLTVLVGRVVDFQSLTTPCLLASGRCWCRKGKRRMGSDTRVLSIQSPVCSGCVGNRAATSFASYPTRCCCRDYLVRVGGSYCRLARCLGTILPLRLLREALWAPSSTSHSFTPVRQAQYWACSR